MEALQDLSGDLILLGRRLIISILILIGGKIVISLSRRVIRRIMHRSALKGRQRADETFYSVLQKIVYYAVVLICLIMILDVFRINTTGLIALLGAAGVAIGFALRDTLSNIASGIVILVLRPFQIGEFIECGTVSGTVRDIGLFTTILETGDGVFISAPNSNFWGVPLKNFSRNEKRRLEITVNITHSESIDRAFLTLNEIILAEQRFLKEPVPQVMVQSLGDFGISIGLRAWVMAKDYWTVYYDQMKNIKETFESRGIALTRRFTTV